MKILSLFQASYGRSTRPTRIAKLASKFGHVTICALDCVQPLNENMTFVPLGIRDKSLAHQAIRACMLLLRRHKHDYWPPFVQKVYDTLHNQAFDIIFCHDLHLVPLACALKECHPNKKIQVVIDLREFYPKQFEQRRIWKMLVAPYYDYLCRTFLPKADIFFTVSPGLVKAYQAQYNIPCTLLPSLSYYHDDITPHSTSWPIRCIHHGNGSPGRKLENMITAFIPLKGKYTLDLMLMSNEPKYLQSLKHMAAPYEHINIIAPVPMPEIVSHIAKYDLGIYLLTPDSFNHKHAWPNKLFEFIQARLGIVVSPVPDMSELVLNNGVGCVTADFAATSLTKLLTELQTTNIDAYKQKSHEVAKTFSWEENEKWLMEQFFSQP